MFTKIKEWILGNVIVSKVIGKLIKHATGAVVGLLFSLKLAPTMGPIFASMNMDQAKVEATLIIFFTGLFGAGWNFIEHRFFVK